MTDTSPPVEVVLVARREENPGQAIAVGLITAAVRALVSGLGLMLLVPLAAEVFGLTHRTPGYWTCVALMYLARMTYAGVAAKTRPIATKAAA